MRLLVAEDDRSLAHTLRKILVEERFAVDVAMRGDEAIHQATEVAYDAIVLDLMLPGVDGWTVLDTLRRKHVRTPVVILTARDGLPDRVRGLNAGADDYIVKPFAVTELVARIRAVIRRASANPSPVVVVGDVTINTSNRLVERAGRLVDLDGARVRDPRVPRDAARHAGHAYGPAGAHLRRRRRGGVERGGRARRRAPAQARTGRRPDPPRPWLHRRRLARCVSV